MVKQLIMKNVTVNKNAVETDGLEYAIFETSQNQYVQTNGTLGASAIWRTTAQWGTVTVNGLANDSYTYQFKVKSRNTSDGSNAASSESALSGGASSANQSPVIVLGSIAQTTDGSRYVTINYTGSDLESENTTIITAEYSTNGTTWNNMTEKSGVGSDGKTGLVFVYTGTAHDFMWDVGTDLANVEDSTVFIRLQANDGTSDGGVATSSAFTIDAKNPVISSVSAEQQNGSNNVVFSYTLTDLSNSLVEIDISDDGGATWNVTDTSVTGDIGAGVSPGTGKTITWNPGVDFSGQEQSDLRVRVRATDIFGNAGANASSANFSVDTESPRITNVTASQDSGLNTVTIGYDIEDANVSNVVIEISEDNGLTWGVATTTLSGDVGAGITSGIGKIVSWNAAVDFPNREQSGMMIRVRATDSHNNLSGNVFSPSFSVDTLAPVISSVSASQTLGSDNVVFTYNLSDSGFVNIELDISQDSGATWTVTDTSVIGAIGSGQTTGNGKTITWNAGVDYPDEDRSTMRVRIRGTDGFSNMSVNVESSDFIIDTFDPTPNVTSNLQSQPNAGDTTVLIGGSFTETNPNTNDFYVAINGGAYGSATSGTTNTSSPSNQATSVGSTLDGNDYISKVKITHTDDYGHSVTNQNTSPNTSLKYVKPYTPQAPTVNNPQNTSVDVTIIPHASETSGLEYAIFETTTGKYVKANGTLDTSPVWRTTTAWGTITVTGLSSPVAQYSFKVKSRNTSDTLNAVSSESNFSSSNAIANTSPSISITSVAQQTSTSYALIEYIGTDTQNDTNNLTTFEYSTDGSSWNVMTEKSGVGSDGTSGLIFTSSGAAFTFGWDIAADLPNTGDQTVYVRLQSTDTLANSNMATSSAFAVDTLGPVISNIQISQAPGTNIMTFTYDLSDSTAANNTVTLQISSDAGLTWTVPTTSATGDVGSGVSSGLARSITWNAGVDFDNQENSTMQIRLQGTDVYDNSGAISTSSNFTVDTKSPVVSGVSAVQVDDSKNVQVNYTLSDLSSGGLLVEFSISSDNGTTWTVPAVTYSGDVGSGQTTGAKQFVWNAGADFDDEYQDDMKVRVRARDYFANQGVYTSSSVFEVDTRASVVSDVSAVQNTGARTVNIAYDLTDDTSSNLNVEFEVSEDNGISWTIAHSSSTGNVGSGQTTGAGKIIVWDAGTDFDGQFQTDMKVRVRATDRFTNQGSFVDSSAFTLDTANPVVSNVSGSQILGSETVSISYNLTDGTSTNLSTVLEISSDNGTTWTVPTTSASGNIGSGQTTGAGKTITWNAGVDFDSNANSNMEARIRANDSFSNQGNFTSSSNFSVDTKDPATLASSDLQAQPHAGDTSVLIGGSFIETSPNTNNFFVAVNGNGYGSASAGDSDTTSPSNHLTPVGITLKGNNRIGKVKIVHADDYGHSFTNENLSPATAFKFVKPYTPMAPTVSNPTTNSVDVVVNKNANEVSGLEYAIYETTQNKYVQANGTLGASAVWQTGAVWGTVTVTGLNSPVSSYMFKTKSRNSADVAHAATSESDLSSSASVSQTAPSITIDSVSQSSGNGYVIINYTGVDEQNDVSNISVKEYSLNGIDWFDMTEKSGVGSDGIAGLEFTTTGASFIFAWDAQTDVSDFEDFIYVRLRANDGVQDGNIETSSAFALDLKSPVVSNVSATQLAGTTSIEISYDVSDFTSNISVAFEISSDNGSTWTVPTTSATGDFGSGQTTGNGKMITWNADLDFDGQYQTDMKVRVRATDSFSNQGDFSESPAFAVETANPVVSNLSAVQMAGTSDVAVFYDLSDDTSTDLTVVFDISDDNGSTWTVVDTSVTGDIGSGQTTGINKSFIWDAGTDFAEQYQTDMKVRARATDSFSNQGDFTESSSFSVDTDVPVVSNVTSSQASDSASVTITYDLSDNTSTDLTVVFDISDDNGSTWTVVDTSVTGDIGSGQTTGINKLFIWDAGTDFGNEYQTDMKVRVRATDSFSNQGDNSESNVFVLDTSAPVISNVSASQNLGFGTVTISYDISDDVLTDLIVDLNVSNDGGLTWTVSHPSVSGDIGLGQTAGVGKTIIWNAGADFDDQDLSTMRIRLIGTDSFGNISSPFVSTDFAVDTMDPIGLATFGKFLSTSTSVTMNWGSVVDTNFDHYELWYGNNQTDVQNRSGSALIWSVDDDSDLDNSLTASTTITGITLEADLFVKIWAVDSFGHEITAQDVNVFTPVAAAGAVGGGQLLDLIPPNKPVLNPVATPTNNTTAIIAGLSEPNSYIDLYDNGVFVKRLSSQANASGFFSDDLIFGEGSHLLTATATDLSGNVSEQSDSINLVVDLTAPNKPTAFNKNDSEIFEISPLIFGTSEPFALIKIVIDDTNAVTTSADQNGYWRYLLPTDLALNLGIHTFELTASDLAGNVSEPALLTLHVVIQPILPPSIFTPSIPTIPTISTPGIGLLPGAGLLTVLPTIAPPVPVSEIIKEQVEAIELPGLPTPDIKLASTVYDGRNFVFSGTAIPNSDVVVYIHSDQALIYTSHANGKGDWNVIHSQDATELSKGDHTIYAISIDPIAKIKSAVAPIKIFTVNKSLLVSMFNYLNLRTTIASVLVLLVCIWWLYRLRKRNA
ncbi:exo-alpha-sialidase [Candidatus Uhrbacteria bacterium]|nr:exo-alpha-sialidase [Candidatus Uhrbacteria bacterium]